MLFLSRKVGESIVINDTTRITVMEVRRTGIKLGIECLPGVQVYRQEVYDRIQKKNQEARASGIELFATEQEGEDTKA